MNLSFLEPFQMNEVPLNLQRSYLLYLVIETSSQINCFLMVVLWFFSVRAIIFWLKRIKFYWNLVTFRQTGIIWHFSPYELLCQWYSGSVILFGWSNYLLIKEIPKSYWNLKSNWVRLTGIISLIECFCGMVIT